MNILLALMEECMFVTLGEPWTVNILETLWIVRLHFISILVIYLQNIAYFHITN